MNKKTLKSNEIIAGNTASHNANGEQSNMPKALKVTENIQKLLTGQELRTMLYRLRLVSDSTIFEALRDNQKIVNRFYSDKWNFMMAICLKREKQPNNYWLYSKEGFDVAKVDVALPEIRKRLKCTIFKMWQIKDQLVMGELKDILRHAKEEEIERVGWFIVDTITDNNYD